MTGGFFSLLMLAMAAYVLIGGITGKGKLYAVEGVKEGKEEQFKKLLRILYLAMGLCMLLNTGLSYLRDTMYTYTAVTESETEVADETAEDVKEAAETAEAVPTEEKAETETPADETAPAETDAQQPAETAADEAAAAGEARFVRTDALPGLDISYQALNIASVVMLVLTMGSIVALFIIINKFVDKNAANQKRSGSEKSNGGRSGGSVLPRSAFEFDETDETEK